MTGVAFLISHALHLFSRFGVHVEWAKTSGRLLLNEVVLRESPCRPKPAR